MSNDSDSSVAFQFAAREIFASRYLSIAGYVILMYDAFLSLPDEMAYIWPRRTFRKGVFRFADSKGSHIVWLINKYLVLFILGPKNLELSGLTGWEAGDNSCRSWMIALPMFSFISIFVSNALVLQRVMKIWKERDLVKQALFGILVLTTIGSLITLGVVLQNLLPSISYSFILQMCVGNAQANIHFLVVPWALPLLFDIAAILAAIVNARRQVRDFSAHLVDLKEDGSFYFLALSLLRFFNVMFLGTAPAPLLAAGPFFIWAVITMLNGRFIIMIRRSEISEDEDEDDEELGLKSSGSSLDSAYGCSWDFDVTCLDDDGLTRKVSAQFVPAS